MTIDDLSDHTRFETEYPLWAATDRYGLAVFADDTYGRILFLFTDEDAARQFATGTQAVPIGVLEVPNNAVLLVLLRGAQRYQGVTHVGYDCEPIGSARSGGRFFDIGLVLNRTLRIAENQG